VLAQLPIGPAAQREAVTQSRLSRQDEDQRDPAVGPVPNQPPISRHLPGCHERDEDQLCDRADQNAVSGEAACSTLWANPKTRPWRS
jgi:hypothetical protein